MIATNKKMYKSEENGVYKYRTAQRMAHTPSPDVRPKALIPLYDKLNIRNNHPRTSSPLPLLLPLATKRSLHYLISYQYTLRPHVLRMAAWVDAGTR